MDDILAAIFILLMYGIPLGGVIYTLSKFLKRRILLVKMIPAEGRNHRFINAKNTLLAVGILYGLFLLVTLVLLAFRPPWFDPPLWLKAVLIILFVPYLACVYGLYGLGEMGNVGVSPSKILKEVKNTIAKEYCNCDDKKE